MVFRNLSYFTSSTPIPTSLEEGSLHGCLLGHPSFSQSIRTPSDTTHPNTPTLGLRTRGRPNPRTKRTSGTGGSSSTEYTQNDCLPFPTSPTPKTPHGDTLTTRIYNPSTSIPSRSSPYVPNRQNPHYGRPRPERSRDVLVLSQLPLIPFLPLGHVGHSLVTGTVGVTRGRKSGNGEKRHGMRTPQGIDLRL